MLFLYDFFLTFGSEVRFVWPAKSSFARTAFLLNKYVVIAVLIGTAYGEYIVSNEKETR